MAFLVHRDVAGCSPDADGSELPRRIIPAIVCIPSDHLVVIGDSISSGIDSHVPAWPVVMQQSTGVPVKNLSRPGAQVAEGQDMAGGGVKEGRPLPFVGRWREVLFGRRSVRVARTQPRVLLQ